MKTFIKVIAVVLCFAIAFPMYAFGWENTMTVVTPPTRTDFYEGLDWIMTYQEVATYGNIDLSGIVLENMGEEIPYHRFFWGPNIICEPVGGEWKVGENQVYYLVDDLDDLCAMGTVTFHRIQSVSMINTPKDTTYIRGVDWDYNEKGKITFRKVKLDGILLRVTCTNGATYDVKNNGTILWSLASDDYEFFVGHNQICALFSGTETPFDIDIVLESITDVERNDNDVKREYSYGDDWIYVRGQPLADIDLSGLSITASYNNNTQQVYNYNDCPERFSIDENQTLRTGSNKVKVLFDSTFPIYIDTVLYRYGDVDSDGMVNSSDALTILKYAVGTAELNEGQLKYADVNDDGRINSADALQIQKKSVGLIRLFDAEI